MNFKNGFVVLWTAFLIQSGCGGSDSSQGAPVVPPAPTASAASTHASVTRVHWIGKTQLAARADAAYAMGVWNMPESRTLEEQTIHKLAAAPWIVMGLQTHSNEVARLRPLVEDVLASECCFEMRARTNEPGQMVLAIRLTERRADLWETNLAATLVSLTGIQPASNPRGWSLKKHDAPNLLEFSRAGAWTLVGAAQDRNSLLEETAARIQSGQSPWVGAESNAWLQIELDPSRVANALVSGAILPGNWPRISLTMEGAGTNVHTQGTLRFAQAPPLEFDSWNVPISLMTRPMTSFTAMRGFKPWLGSLKAWNELQTGPAPNQLYLWAMGGMGMDSFGAAPLPGASNVVRSMSDHVLTKWSSLFQTNKLAKFVRAKSFNGLEWQGVGWMAPSLRSMLLTNGEFVFGGLFPNSPTPPPADYFDEALGKTNLVYYDWEITGERLPQMLFIGQFTRFVSEHAQMPFQCASLNWLKAIGPKLGKNITRITVTGPKEFTFDRTSSIGLTAVELHVLADWLESPLFPLGLHTISAQPE